MMNAGNEKVVATLNHLIMTCKDGQEGFHNAGEGVKTTELKHLFYSFAQQRMQLISELQPEVRSLGGNPDQGGSLSEALHRGWLNLKQVLVGPNESAVVDEAERAEDIALHTYQEALKASLPPAVRSIVERQYTQIRQAHDRITELRRSQSRPA